MVEIIPKQKSSVQTLPWLNYFFNFSLILLIVSIFVFLILTILENRANHTLKKLEEDFKKIKTTERLNMEKEVITYEKKISDFLFLIENHKITSNLFNYLETITHPSVYFFNLGFNTDENKLTLNGKTDNFQTLGQQFLIFRNEKLIEKVNLTKISFGEEGNIVFSFEIFLSPEIFKLLK